jgi:outer membrane biosynthesis protein TonB
MEATHMKVLGVISTATLFLLLGTVVPTLAQDDHKEAAKPAQQEQAKPAKQEQQAKPAKQEEQAKPARQEQAKSTNQQPKEQTKTAKQEPQSKPAQQAKPVKQQQKAKPEQRPEQAKATKPATENKPVKQTADRSNAAGQQHVQRTAADEQRQRAQPALRLSARGDSRIPDARFRSNFGRGHEFQIGSPRLVDGYSRFQYGGYWFGFVQPWPADWYYTDDVYVDYINGEYYLCNPSYPGDQIAISVVL